MKDKPTVIPSERGFLVCGFCFREIEDWNDFYEHQAIYHSEELERIKITDDMIEDSYNFLTDKEIEQLKKEDEEYLNTLTDKERKELLML